MSKDTSPQDKAGNVSGGAHLGGTTFGQTGGDAKTKDSKSGGDKARPNDGKH